MFTVNINEYSRGHSQERNKLAAGKEKHVVCALLDGWIRGGKVKISRFTRNDNGILVKRTCKIENNKAASNERYVTNGKNSRRTTKQLYDASTSCHFEKQATLGHFDERLHHVISTNEVRRNLSVNSPLPGKCAPSTAYWPS